MEKSNIAAANEAIAQKVSGAYGKIETAVVGGYSKVEEAVVGYAKVEDAFVGRYLAKDGESIAEAKERIKRTSGA